MARETRVTVAACCVLGLAAAGAEDLPAQRGGGEIHGFVVDSANGRGLSRAMVVVDGHASAWTDEAGRFTVAGLPAGEHLLAAVTRNCRIGAARIRSGGHGSLWVSLYIGAQTLGPDDPITERIRSGGGSTSTKVVTREQISAMRARSVTDVLHRIAAGMVGGPSGHAGQAPSIRERGVTTVVGPRTPLVLVDGIRVDADALDAIDPHTIARIEVAPGAAGGWEHGTHGASGVIRIFSLRGAHDESPYCGFRVDGPAEHG